MNRAPATLWIGAAMVAVFAFAAALSFVWTPQ